MANEELHSVQDASWKSYLIESISVFLFPHLINKNEAMRICFFYMGILSLSLCQSEDGQPESRDTFVQEKTCESVPCFYRRI